MIAAVRQKKIVYIDEAGMDNRLFREYARAPRGQKIMANIPGKKRERFSVIGALQNKKFIAPLVFQRGCNSERFNAWLKDHLLPKIPKKSLIVMDNASFHKSSLTKFLIQKARCFLLFLPTVSGASFPLRWKPSQSYP